MADIFISYAREDRERVEQLAGLLEARGWSVFWDRKVPTGRSGWSTIDKEVKRARCVVVVWSRYSLDSPAVLAEAEFRFNDDVVRPVQLERLAAFPVPFNRLQAADLSAWTGSPDADDFKGFVAEIEELIGTPAQPAAAPPGRLRWVSAIRRPFARVKAKTVWGAFAGLVVGTAGSIGYVLTKTSDAREQFQKNKGKIESVFLDIADTAYPAKRKSAFAWLEQDEPFGLSLENYAIEKMVQLVRDEHPRNRRCVLADSGVSPGATEREFNVIRHLQEKLGRKPSWSGLAYDWVTRTFAADLYVSPKRMILDNTDLRRANLSGLHLDSASFRNACLTLARFGKAHLRMADFTGDTLHRTQFNGAHLQCAFFVNAKLIGVNFEFASLAWSTFSGAQLRGISNWRLVVDSFSQVRFGETVTGNPERDTLVAVARTMKAAPDSVAMRDWVRARDQQWQQGGLCAPNPQVERP
jgi:hypothetical protein